MLVLVEATDPFVTMFDGDMVSAIKGERVMLPKARATQLVESGLAIFPAPVAAPENKAEGPAPEVKQPRKRQPAKPKPKPAVSEAKAE